MSVCPQGKKVCKIRPEFVIFDPQLGPQELANWYNLTVPVGGKAQYSPPFCHDNPQYDPQYNAGSGYHSPADNSDASDIDGDTRSSSTPTSRRRRRARRERRRRNPQ